MWRADPQRQSEQLPTPERQEPVEAEPARPAPGSSGLSAPAILALQRAGGNQQVLRMLAVARQTAAPTATPNKIEQLDEMLDRSDVPEDDVIALLATLNAAEKNTVLTGGYKGKLADPLDRHEMVRAVNNLGPPLAVKLEWVAAAAGGADELDYSDIKSLVTAAPQGERDALKSGPWRGFFVEVCNDKTILEAAADMKFDLATKLDWIGAEYDFDDLGYAEIQKLVLAAPQGERDVLKTRPWRDWFGKVCTDKTMATAVMDLGFDLKTKLAWMIYEDTNIDLVGMVIRNTPAADLPPVAADTAFLETLHDELGDTNYAVAHRMLTQGLLGEAIVDTDPSSFDIESKVALFRNGLTVSKEVEFVEKGKFGPGGFSTLKTRIINAVTTWLSGRYKVRIASVGTAREGDGVYPITVQVIDNPSADFTMKLHGGEHGRSSVGESSGNIYELGQASESGIMDITLAHESAHLVLGADDEYADADEPGRKVFTDHSLMGSYRSEGIAAAEIKDRHFGFAVKTVAKWFPGRSISIVR
jgi:hypothetical protein